MPRQQRTNFMKSEPTDNSGASKPRVKLFELFVDIVGGVLSLAVLIGGVIAVVFWLMNRSETQLNWIAVLSVTWLVATWLCATFVRDSSTQLTCAIACKIAAFPAIPFLFLHAANFSHTHFGLRGVFAFIAFAIGVIWGISKLVEGCRSRFLNAALEQHGLREIGPGTHFLFAHRSVTPRHQAFATSQFSLWVEAADGVRRQVWVSISGNWFALINPVVEVWDVDPPLPGAQGKHSERGGIADNC